MKKMMILVSAVMTVAAAYANTNVNVNNTEVKPFEGVRVNVPARLRFVSGDNYEMGVRGTDSIAANSIQWSVEDGVLNIRSRYEMPENPESEVCITIVSPVMPKLTVGRSYEVHPKAGDRELVASK